MKFRKIISSVVAVSSIAATAVGLAGCALGGNRAPAQIDVEALLSVDDPENFVYDEPVTIRIPVYDRGQSGLPPVTDNYWTRLAQKEMKKLHNIDLEFVSIPRNGEVTKFNQLMAGKVSKQPDILFHYDYPQIITYAKQGAFQTIDERLIKAYAPDYWEATQELDEYTYVNGEKKFIGGTRPKAYNFISVIRKDWIEKCGYEVPKTAEEEANWTLTEDEYFEMLQKFKDNNCGGSATIPLGFSLPNANFGNHGYRDYPLSANDWALYSDLSVASLTWEPTYKTLKYDWELNQKGLISSEWNIDQSGDTSKQNFISGKQGVYGFYLTKSNDVLGGLTDLVPDAEVILVPNVKSEDEATGEYILKGGRADNPFGLMSGINVHCQHPEAVLMYFEWLQDNLDLMQYGIEGQNYHLEKYTMEDGTSFDLKVIDDSYQGESMFNYNSNKDMWCLVTEGRQGKTPEEDLAIAMYTYAPEGYEHLIEASYMRAKDGDFRNYIDFLFDRSIDSLADKSATLLNDFRQAATDWINAKTEEEFDKNYKKWCDQYLKDGYAEILKEKQAAYDDMKATGKLMTELPYGIKPDDDDTTRHMAAPPEGKGEDTEKETKKEEATAPDATSSEAKASEEDKTTD